jgi:hypothetical protein
MYFVWISEQTAIISLYNIKWLVCTTETECVYCAVRTGCLYIISLNFNFVFLWVRRSFTGLSPEMSAFDPRLFHVGFMVGKLALGHVFSEKFGFSSRCDAIDAPWSYLSTCRCHQKTNRRRLWFLNRGALDSRVVPRVCYWKGYAVQAAECQHSSSCGCWPSDRQTVGPSDRHTVSLYMPTFNLI